MIPELTPTGPPRERGRIHGEAVRTMMPDAIDRWLARLDETGAPGDFVGRLVGETQLLDTAERETPDLVEEVCGIAEGADQPFETMLAWQFIDEAWWYLDELTAMYASGAICQSRSLDSPVISVGTMLFELGDEQACHYSPGPLDEESLSTYRIRGNADR